VRARRFGDRRSGQNPFGVDLVRAGERADGSRCSLKTIEGADYRPALRWSSSCRYDAPDARATRAACSLRAAGGKLLLTARPIPRMGLVHRRFEIALRFLLAFAVGAGRRGCHGSHPKHFSDRQLESPTPPGAPLTHLERTRRPLPPLSRDR